MHSTAAYLAKKIIATGEIEPRPCDIFVGENLAYFFVGRAAYKKLGDEAPYWELPSSFVFEFTSKGARRVFPFDSGAFARKQYPSYVSMMEMSDYELSSDPAATEKLIGTFFGSSDGYFHMKPRPEDDFDRTFEIDVLDEEVKALYYLIHNKGGSRADDRRFAIEMQFPSAFKLSHRRPLCIILPEPYLKNQAYIDSILNTGATLLTYPIYPLRKDFYYYAIYQKLDEFYRSRGMY